MPEKCILEAFGTGVPNGIVTVKNVDSQWIINSTESQFQVYDDFEPPKMAIRQIGKAVTMWSMVSSLDSLSN